MRGYVVDITDKLTSESAPLLAQWIGAANVIRNQKIRDNELDYQSFLKNGGDRPRIHQGASHIHKRDGLYFLKDVPAEVRRNAATMWYQDMNAALKGLRKAPRVKGKSKKRSVYLTKELFVIHRLDDEHCLIRIRRSSKKCDLHNFILHVRLPFHHADASNSLRISRQGRRFWLSTSYRKEFDVPDEAAIRKSFSDLDEKAASDRVSGFDIGVVRQVTDSSGTVYHMSEAEAEKLKKLEKKRIRYQKKYSRIARANDRKAKTNKRKRTNGEKAVSQHIAQIDAKRARIRKNTSHRLSKRIAEASPTIAAFEDSNLQNMTRRAKAKQCPDTGKWLRNNARAKSGLNKAILNLNLGEIRSFTAYKLADRGKLMIKVPAAYSSQECAECGHTDKANRPDQATFHCQKCGHKDNADNNAARVLRQRGITLVLSKTFAASAKKAKQIAVKKNKARDTASPGDGANVRRVRPQPASMSQTDNSYAPSA